MSDTWLDNVFELVVIKTAVPIALLLMVAMILSIPMFIYVAYEDATSPTISIRKDKWTCTKTYTYYTSVKGIRTAHEDCSMYVREQK